MPASSYSENTTASFFPDDMATCDQMSEEVSSDQVKVIGETMAAHAHRLNHVLWHATRNAWSELSPGDRSAIQKLSPEWGKNAPLCPAPSRTLSTSKGNPAGEEFLLMHHQMVDTLRMALEDAELPCIAGWKTLPGKNDPSFPVPAGASDDTSKSDDNGIRMGAWAKQIHDPAFLKGKSLSYIGILLEFTLHNNMHMRWATRPGSGDDFSPLDESKLTTESLLKPSPEHDDPKFNWLGNPYSAHVNPVFWKLHGFVDDTIPLWLKANGYQSIAQDCRGKAGCYQWKSRWVGAATHDHAKSMSSMGGISSGHYGGLTPDEERAANRAMNKIFKRAGFDNPKFLKAQNAVKTALPKDGAPPSAPARDTSLDDAETFLRLYGPCSG